MPEKHLFSSVELFLISTWNMGAGPSYSSYDSISVIYPLAIVTEGYKNKINMCRDN